MLIIFYLYYKVNNMVIIENLNNGTKYKLIIILNIVNPQSRDHRHSNACTFLLQNLESFEAIAL